MSLETDPTMRTWVEIDLRALLHNYNIARATGRKVMCVIKADGYGHGAVPLGLFLQRHGADAFAVACLDEAITLREAGITLPILILGYTPPVYAGMLATYQLSSTIVDMQAALELSEAAQSAGVRLPIHIKLDTGMSRLGFLAQSDAQAAATAEAVARCAALPGLSIEGMFTHFAVADTPAETEYTRRQIALYNAVRGRLRERSVFMPLCHASNSAAILGHPEAHFDMVREGIMLYGLYPDSAPRENGPLQPVMSLKTRVVQIKEFPAGTTLSYGRTFETTRDTRVAVLCAGYADGYPRRQSNLGAVTIGGTRYPQIGRICMDMCMVDITGAGVQRGDEAILMGAGGAALEEVGQNVGTINYELACLVTPRVRRVYLNADT